ncbi:two-component regulator propeller domain-containing protein [Abyssalbus ytuae]|uniref:Helix-turn-helix domain-containing protein n=1 Tax=Abyssalbus ytuae TaxID=2926907 RepID=A0A9E6ZLY4_9FLAO|nr:two-component regulator propeller domain-containing protein [Abyssalbus ytuae]UOB16715.1 helix-turn-helix domain-containing protein [Abyssalbus ytuae]
MKLTFFFFLIFLYGLIHAQNIKFKSLTTEDGLSNNSVNDIISDDKGRLWIATWDGLNLYDGHHFKVFKNEQNSTASIGGNVVYELCRDSNKNIWILTDNNSVSRYIGNNRFENYFFHYPPNELFLSKSGEIFVRCDSIYFKFDDKNFIKSTNPGMKQKDKTILNNLLLTKYPDLLINESLKDREGNIWYATRNNGLYIIPNHISNIHNDQVEHYLYDLYSPYSFTSNEIEKLYEDDFGNVWLGHKDGGISMAYKGSQQITTVTPHPVTFPHLPNETIRAITKDFHSNIWIGYYTEGLFYYSPKTKCYLKFNISKAKKNKDWNRIRSLFTSSDGSVWAGTYAGVIQIKNNICTYYTAKENNNFPNNRNYSFYEDDNKHLWIACWGGLAKFSLDHLKFEAFTGQEKLNDLHIRKVIATDNKIVLATEKNGVVILNPSTGETFSITIKNGLLGNSIYSVFKDEETDYYWIASLGGISVYNKQKGIIKNITENNGLPSHMVYSLTLNNEKVWISTTKGIAAIDKKDFSVMSLNPDEGWQATEFSEGAYYHDMKGTLFFGGINGLNYFHPSKISFSTELPKLHVNIDNANNYSPTIVKKYFDNFLKIEITPVSFTKSINNKVLYKLSGYDKTWNEFSLNPILYNDLPSGHYTLEVKNSLSKNEDENIQVDIIIEKPFYNTFPFYSILFILSLIVTSYLIVNKNRKTIRYQKKLEEKILERTCIINQQKQDLLLINNELDEKNKAISQQKEQLLKIHHNLKNQDFEIEKFKTFVLSEFKEPLAKIIEISNKLSNNEEEEKKAISQQSGKLINLLLEWDYLDQVSDLDDSRTATAKLTAILKPLAENLKLLALKNKINLDYHVDIDDFWVEIDILRFKLLFKYLFNDIIKYATKNSHLQVIIKNKKHLITLKIQSDSKILAENFLSIQHFSPYFRAVKTLTEALHGTLKTDKKSKIDIIVELPVKIVNIEGNFTDEINWKHLNLSERLPADKNNILVLCNENDCSSSLQLLENEQNNLLFENTVGAVSSAVKHLNVDALILYNTPLTDKLVKFLNNMKNNDLQKTLPIIYISEQIDYFLQELTIELVDTFIQLPASKLFIQKKILKLLKTREEYQKESFKKEFFNFISEPEGVISQNEMLVKKALKIIKSNISDPSFNVESLQKQLQISRIKCYRIFKEVLKQSPSDIIINLRMQKAEYLLKNKPLNISEVSFECGFNDPKYFGRLFKRHFGNSPKVYKNQN